jgi:hypothetical protein
MALTPEVPPVPLAVEAEVPWMATALPVVEVLLMVKRGGVAEAWEAE